MSRINTNVGALIAQTRLARSQSQLSETLQRLSTGLRINRGADDPAGLIASERLRSEMAGLGQAITNSERASNVIATAEGALNEAANLLVSVQELIVEAANTGALSEDEIAANQLQVDSAIASITRISNTTTFAGLYLLNGNMEYQTSGIDDTKIHDLHLYSVNFGTQDYIPVTVDVLASAQKAELQFRTSSLSEGVTIQVRGNEGVSELTFGSGTTASAIAFAVNTIADATGVAASYLNSTNAASGVSFHSTEYGSNAFVSIKALQSGTSFEVVNADGIENYVDNGQDVSASVNGMLCAGNGLELSMQGLGLDLDMIVDESLGLGSTNFAITSGGAKFQLGPAVNSNQQVNIGIRSIAASSLGTTEVGYLSQIRTGEAYSLVSGHAKEASDIIQEAISQVAILRGRLGAFEKNTLDTNINSLQITLENVTSSESQIRDADFAYETSQLTRNQILVQAGTSVLGIANSTPKTVLSLLQQ